jgi:hypothetical protein
MAGSLNHIVEQDGSFTMEGIENLRDAHEALVECHQIIAFLLHGDKGAQSRLSHICKMLSFPGAVVPKLQPELTPAHAPINREPKADVRTQLEKIEIGGHVFYSDRTAMLTLDDTGSVAGIVTLSGKRVPLPPMTFKAWDGENV